MKTFSIQKAVSYGFRTFWEHIGFFISVGIIINLIAWGLYLALEEVLYNRIEPVGLTVTAVILLIILAAVWSFYLYVYLSLKIYDTGTATLSDIFAFRWQLPRLVLVTLIVAVVGILGFIALLIPGIYWITRSLFVIEAVFDRYDDPIQHSLKITQGRVWRIIELIAVLFAICVVFYMSSLLKYLCFSFPVTIVQLGGCLLFTSFISSVVIWAGMIVTTLIRVHVYRQLSPKRRRIF